MLVVSPRYEVMQFPNKGKLGALVHRYVEDYSMSREGRLSFGVPNEWSLTHNTFLVFQLEECLVI